MRTFADEVEGAAAELEEGVGTVCTGEELEDRSAAEMEEGAVVGPTCAAAELRPEEAAAELEEGAAVGPRFSVVRPREAPL